MLLAGTNIAAVAVVLQAYGIYFDRKKSVDRFSGFEVADATYSDERFRVRVRNYVFVPLFPRVRLRNGIPHVVEYSSYAQEISLR